MILQNIKGDDMKKKMILILFAAILMFACNNQKPNTTESQEVGVEEPEFLGDEKMDRYKREYVNEAIVIKSEELTDLVADFWSRITLGDTSFTDLVYLPEDKLNALKEIMNTEEGRKVLVKMLEKSTITADGINDANFLKINIDSNGNSFKNENESNIVYTGVSHKYLYDVLSIKNKKPITIASDLLKFVEDYNANYKAVDENNTGFNFVYVNGKPMIDGELFFGMFGLFKELSADDKYITDLVKDAYYEDADDIGDMEDMYKYIQDGEYVWMYELLRKSDLLDTITYSPKDSIKKLYSISDERRGDFLAEMRRLPKPIVRAVKKDGQNKIVAVYFYKDMYGSLPTGNIVDSKFEMSELKNFEGIVIDNIVKNLLLIQDINVDEMSTNEN